MSLAPPAVRSLTLTAHVAFWGIAGTAAVGYLGLFVLGAGNLQALIQGADRGQGQALVGIERAVLQLSADVRAVEGKIATTEENGQALLGRIASLEEKSALQSSPVTANRGEPEARSGETRQAPLRASEITTGTILQRSVPPVPATPAAAPVAATAVAPPPPPPKPVHGIQLSSAANLDALRLNWSLLSERHRDLLGPLQTRYRQAAGKPNAPMQLIAGPVRSPGEAVRICKALAASGVPCRATTFSGESL